MVKTQDDVWRQEKGEYHIGHFFLGHNIGLVLGNFLPSLVYEAFCTLDEKSDPGQKGLPSNNR